MSRELAGLVMMLLILSGCPGGTPDNLGTRNGNLAPCPGAPNCVSTQSRDPKRSMAPLPFIGTRDQARSRIIRIVDAMDRSEIVDATDSYVYARFRTKLLGFTDDVEFLFDEKTQVVHFRSASRVGYYDFGLNRRRMNEISKAYLRE